MPQSCQNYVKPIYLNISNFIDFSSNCAYNLLDELAKGGQESGLPHIPGGR